MEKEFGLLNNKISSEEKESYITPDIEVVEIEIEQSILQGGSDRVSGSGYTQDMAPEAW